MSTTINLKAFWEWKRKDLIVQMMNGKFDRWSVFEKCWHEVANKVDEYPDKKSALFLDFIYWKTKGFPVITDILPDANHLQTYFDNCVSGSKNVATKL